MKKGILINLIIAMLCMCLIAGAFVGCSGNSQQPETTSESAEDLAAFENIDPKELAELTDCYDPEVDVDLDAARSNNNEAPVAGTIISGQDITFTNSNLVEYTRLSPNKTIHRNHKIDTITIHCMLGKLTVEACGNVFSESKANASSNYGVDDDGRIALYVQEWDRSWCSSNADNDHRAVTIKVASEFSHPYAVSDKAYNTTIKLVADICKRNGIEKLVWSDDKEARIKHLDGANMTVHSDFADTVCPGEFLYSRMGDIAKQVNRILEETKGQTVTGRKCSEEKKFEEYLVKITKTTSVRRNPGLKGSYVMKVNKNEIYTIVDEKTVDNIKWGKLKSGKGWINLADTQKK